MRLNAVSVAASRDRQYGNSMSGKLSKSNKYSVGNTTPGVSSWPSAAYVENAATDIRHEVLVNTLMITASV